MPLRSTGGVGGCGGAAVDGANTAAGGDSVYSSTWSIPMNHPLSTDFVPPQ